MLSSVSARNRPWLYEGTITLMVGNSVRRARITVQPPSPRPAAPSPALTQEGGSHASGIDVGFQEARDIAAFTTRRKADSDDWSLQGHPVGVAEVCLVRPVGLACRVQQCISSRGALKSIVC